MARKKKRKAMTDLNVLPLLNVFSVLIPVVMMNTSFAKIGIVDVTMPERSDMVMDANAPPPDPDDQALSLTVAVTNDYIQIVARGGMLPMLFYKEMWTFHCRADNDTITYDPKILQLHPDGTFTNPPKCRNGSETNKYEIETIQLWSIAKTSDEDPGTIQTSLYSMYDSAYVDGNSEFVTTKAGIQPGSVLATLRESSARKITMDDYKNMKIVPRSAYDELAKALIGIHSRFIDAPDADDIIVLADDNTAFDKVIGVMDRARDSGFWKISLAKLGG